MNCEQVNNLLQDYIDGDLPEAQLKALTEHHQICSTCESNYRKAVQIRTLLQTMPVPPASEGFVDRVLNKAQHSSDNQKPVIYKAFAGAIAAGFAIWFITASTLLTTPVNTQNSTNDIYKVMVSNEIKTIKVAIESKYKLSNVQMSIELSPNLELAGFGSRTSINWNTQLKKGINLIQLPILGLAAGDGEIITRIQMNGKEKIMHIRTNYQIPDNVWHLTNTNINT